MNYESKLDEQAVNAHEDSGAQEPYIADSEEKKSYRWLWVTVAIIAVVLIALLAYKYATSGADDGSDANSQAPAVTVVVPGNGQVERIINATGTLAARREMPVGVVGEGGEVARVLVEPGDWVKAGQVLAIIDQSVQAQQVRSMAAQVDVAKADAQLAQNELDRALQLVDRGFISKADVDRKRATRDAAAARVKVAQAQYSEMRARTGRLNIRAPKGGLVLERNVEPGQVVGAGSGVLFRLAEGGMMELKARLSEEDLASLSVGVKAEVTPAGFDKTFVGQVWQISPVIDEQNRQGIARISLGYHEALRPGGFANAKVVSGSSNTPVLAESAVQSDDKSSYVFIVGKDNKIERRNVTLGTITADGITILEGLSGKEKVVLYAAAFLNEGETVKPVMDNSGK